MRTFLTLLILVLQVPFMPAAEAGKHAVELSYRQLSSKTALSLSWESEKGTSGELLISQMRHGLNDEIGLRFQHDMFSFGRLIYSGAYRLFASVSQVLSPDDLTSRALWSLRVSELSARKLAAAAEGSAGDFDWYAFIDAERYAAGASATYTRGNLQLSAAGIAAWNSREGIEERLTYQRRIVPGSSFMTAFWGGFAGEHIHIAGAFGWCLSPYRAPGWWVQGSCSWDVLLSEGSAGVFAAVHPDRVWNVTGETAPSRLNIESEATLCAGMPVKLFWSFQYSLSPVPPRPEGRYLPGKAEAGIGAELETEFITLTVLREETADWREGELSFTPGIVLQKEAAFNAFKLDFEAVWKGSAYLRDSLSGKAVWKPGVRTVKIEASSGEEMKVNLEIIQPADWGKIGVSLDSHQGIGLTVEASLALHSR